MGNLLYWAVIFLIVALVAAFLGFGGVAGVATEGARRFVVHRGDAAARVEQFCIELNKV